MKKIKKIEKATYAALPSLLLDKSGKKRVEKGTSGNVDQEVERLKGELHLAVIVLLVGFMLMLATIGIFEIQTLGETRASYENLLDKADTLQAKVDILTK